MLPKSAILLLFLALTVLVECIPSGSSDGQNREKIEDRFHVIKSEYGPIVPDEGYGYAPEKNNARQRKTRNIFKSWWNAVKSSRPFKVAVGGGIGALQEVIPNPVQFAKVVFGAIKNPHETGIKIAQSHLIKDWKCGNNPTIEGLTKNTVLMACPVQAYDINECCASHDACYTDQRKLTNGAAHGKNFCDDLMDSCLVEASAGVCNNLVKTFVTTVREYGWDSYNGK